MSDHHVTSSTESPLPAGPTTIIPITTAPNKPRRFGRMLGVLSGLGLCLVGFVLSVPLLAIVIITVVFAFMTDDFAAPEADVILTIVACTVGAVLAWLIGLRQLRGQPRTVLFLRKFGFGDAKEFVTNAASRALGQQWRLVTLDDFETPALGTSRVKRFASRAGVGVAILVIVGLGFVLADLVADSGNVTSSDSTVGSAESVGDAIANVITAVIVAAVTAAFIAFVAILVSIVAAVVGIAGFASFAASRGLARAENDRRGRARSRNELVAFLDRVEEAKKKLFAPRISVVRVIDALWREAVTGLSDLSDAVLIDISDPSESLLWEVRTLMQRPGTRLVLIGSQERVNSLVAVGGHDHDDAAVLQELAGRSVLLYGDDRKAFARELRRMLEFSLAN